MPDADNVSDREKWEVDVRLRERELAVREREAADGQPIAPWRFHDLRRTFVSGCARLRIPTEVVERAMKHTSETFGGVRGVYNVHGFDDERRETRDDECMVESLAGHSQPKSACLTSWLSS
jgi:integrase